MKLHIQEQTYYALPTLRATPAGSTTPITVPVTSWEASYDRGTTWHAAQPHPDQPTTPCWLVRGPGFPGPGDTNPTGGILVARSTMPLIRLSDSPETEIEAAEIIEVWR